MDFYGPTHLMVISPTVHALAMLYTLPGLGLFRHPHPAPPDTLPPLWVNASMLALQDSLVLSALPPAGPRQPPRLLLAPTADPRQMVIGFDPDSGTVTTQQMLGDVALAPGARFSLIAYAHEMTLLSYQRLWHDMSVSSVNSLGSNTPSSAAHTGLSFALPSPLPPKVQSLLGPGGPALNVSGSENISFSGTSTWTNQQIGLIGSNHSLFPTLDMQQTLDIRLEGQLSDRIKVNLLQNSLNQIPLSNRIAINYKGDEDDLIQEFDLGNTSLSLPGTQYVSYSGMNEGLFGMKASARTGPLDLTLLASRQEGRSERASFQGGTGKRENVFMDVDFVRLVYFFLSDPNLGPRLIDQTTLHVYITPPSISADANLIRGRARVDPNGTDSSSVRGNFRELIAGADKDFEILQYYGPNFIVLKLHQPVDPRTCLAVTYNYSQVDANGKPVGTAIAVGGTDSTLADGSVERSMELVRPPEDQLVKVQGAGLGSPVFYADSGAFNPTRELELKNIYQLGGSRIDPKTFSLTIRQGTNQPYVLSILTPQGPVPYIEAVGLDNYDETSGTPVFGQHDGRVDGTAAGSNGQLHVAVDFDNGLLFLPDPHPFAPRIGASGKPFDNAVSGVLSRRATLTGSADSANAANPNIYKKYVNQGALDALYYLDAQFTAASIGNQIQLGRGNILAGSEVVSVNGVAWKPNVDYTIDYDLGTVVLKRAVGPNDNLNIDYAYAPLFQQSSQTLIGSAFHLVGRDRSLGGAFLYESHAAQDLRPRLGEEPSRSLITDLNGDWLMHPTFLTRFANHLPGVRTTAPSDFHIQAEVGASFPDPNTQNVIYIDDMESARDAISLSMGPERWHWSSVPSRMVNGIPQLVNSLDHQHNAEIHWYSPVNIVKENELKPTLTQAEGGLNTHQVLSLSVPRRPLTARNDFVSGDFDTLWAGVTYLLDPVGLDLSRSQFIEVWVNDFNDLHDVRHPEPRVRGRHLKLHIDVGRVSEDQQRAPDEPPNGLLDSEDQNKDGQLQVTGDLYEDTGYDGKVDSIDVGNHPGAISEHTPMRDLTTASPIDPEGDDFHSADQDFAESDTRRYRSTNGTEGNKNFNPTPDTEDLNLNGNLDTNESYFEYTVDLGDTTSSYPYLAPGGDLQKERAKGTPGYETVAADNGWRLYRIPLADSLRKTFGFPDLTLAQHVRVWIEGMVNTDPDPDSLGGPAPPAPPDNKNFVVRPLLMLGSLDIVASRWQVQPLDSTTTVNGTTVTLNAVNTVDNANIYTAPFDPGQTLNGSQAVTRREQSLAMEFTHFLPNDTLSVFRTFSIDEDYSRYGKMGWYAASFEVPGHIPVVDSLYYFVRFASDEAENNYYEYRAPLPPSSGPHAIAWESVLLQLTTLSNLKLAPNFPRADPILYQVPGLNPNETYTIRGRPSFTRVRRISVGIINASSRDVFESGQLWMDEIRATDVAKDAGHAERIQVDGHIANLFGYNFSYSGQDADFISVGQTRGSGIADGNLSFGGNLDISRFIEGTGISLPFNFAYARSTQTPRYSAGDDVVRNDQQASASQTRNENRTWSLAYSRTWSSHSNPFLLYTMGGITGSLARTTSTAINPSAVDTTVSTIGTVNYGVSLRDLLSLPMPLTKARFFPLPEKVFWNYAISVNNSRSYDRLDDSTRSLVLRNDLQGRVGTIQFGGDFRPIQILHEHFDGTRNLELGDLNQTLGFINFGRVVNWRQAMDASYTLQGGPWLRPTFNWNGGYSQNNGPELSPDLSIRSVTNAQSLTANWGLPFESLVSRAGPHADSTSARYRPLWIRSLLARLGEFGIDGTYTGASAYSRLTGTPSLLYIMGLKRNPGFGAGDTTGRVIEEFGNVESQRTDIGSSVHTRIAVGLGSSINMRGHYGSHWADNNGIVTLGIESQFPDFDVDYGRIPNALRLDRLLKDPHLRTGFNRSTETDYQGTDNEHISSATSTTWSPLIGIDGTTKNGTRAEFKIETRSSTREDLLNGLSVSQDHNTNISLNLTRTYTQGQKMVFLGKTTTLHSTVTLGLTGSYTRRTGGTTRAGDSRIYFPIGQDRLDLNGNGSYAFSNNVTGNATLGFGQTRNLLLNSVYRTIRVELRGQFTF